jgi:hypothetical protein
MNPGHDFWLMQDPEGNEFCLCWPVLTSAEKRG